MPAVVGGLVNSTLGITSAMQDVVELLLKFVLRAFGWIAKAFADEHAQHVVIEQIAHTTAEAIADKASSSEHRGDTDANDQQFLIIERVPEAAAMSFLLAFCTMVAICIAAVVSGDFGLLITKPATVLITLAKLSVFFYCSWFSAIVAPILARSLLIGLNRKIRVFACVATALLGAMCSNWLIATYLFPNLFAW